MSKPIVVIRVSKDAITMPSGEERPYYELGRIFEERLQDYHVFVIPNIDDPSTPQEYFTFQVFYEKDFTPIQYQELKDLVMQSIDKK